MENNVLPAQQWAPYFTRNRTCVCGLTVRVINFPRHIVTKKHEDRMRELKEQQRIIDSNKTQ